MKARGSGTVRTNGVDEMYRGDKNAGREMKVRGKG